MFHVHNCMPWTDVQLDTQVHGGLGHAANLRLGQLNYWFDYSVEVMISGSFGRYNLSPKQCKLSFCENAIPGCKVQDQVSLGYELRISEEFHQVQGMS